MVQRVVVGACLTAHDRLGVFTFSLKALLALRKLKRIKEGKKKKTPLSLLITHYPKVGTRDLLESLVVQTETYCTPVAKGKGKLKLSLGLRIIRRSKEEKVD